ncbi:hypothetical protein BDV12DRAFT_172595 [Aspergillus spectabilis]
MSSGPPVWSAQDEHEARPAAESRPRRSRRKKDDDAEPDRKEPTKTTKLKEKEKEKEKDHRDKDKENLKEKEKGHDKEKEPKRPNRRQRDKSTSISNNPTSAQSTPSHPRKKPKLEATPPKRSPEIAPATPAAISTAPASISVPAPVSVPTPKPSPPIAPAPPSEPVNPPQVSPQSQQIHQSRPLHAPSQLLLSSQPTPPRALTPTTSPPFPVMISAPPSRPQSQPPGPPPQRTSGQNYDPIRSAFGTNSSAPAPPPVPVSASFSPPPRPVSPRPFRASASPAISSIIDPPQHASPTQYAPRPYGSPGRSASSYTPVAPPVAPTHSSLPPTSSPYGHHSPYGPPPPIPSQETHPHARVIASQSQIPPAVPDTKPSVAQLLHSAPEPTPMEVDSQPLAPVTADKVPKKDPKPPTTSASKPPSPKPARPAKEAPPPLPQGSGLISNALFGVDDSSSENSAQLTPNIIVHVPLQGDTNHIVNFARLAEERYGFAALHPRLAAHKERMARVAAAGAALERNDRVGRGISAGESADEDLSLDVDRDSEMDGEGALGAAAAAQANEPPDGKKRRRRRKMEEYDRDDPFVDDSEMVWQEQAAASKDGYFVYSGPLVAEGEKVQVERADGTIKRGRGRGRGGRGRGPATTHAQLPLAAAIPISQETGLPVRGPGSRGGNIHRRPRAKKLEQDKAGGAPPSNGRGGGGAGRGGSTSTRGGKAPMVELAPRPSLAPAPPGLNPMTGSDITMIGK